MAAKKQKKIRQQRFSIAKNLNREEALNVARRRARRDFRAMNYNPETGELILL